MSKLRAELPFDTNFFSKQLAEKDLSVEERFTYIYENNHWAGELSLSGQGSQETQTATISKRLVEIIVEFQIQTMLDLPCGDFHWLKDVALPLSQYMGADIVNTIVDTNKARYENETRQFFSLNLIADTLPAADLLFCRDCLVHFSNEDIIKSLENIKRSGTKYFLTTTFTDCMENEDIVTGDWRVINLTKAPFHLPDPVLLINENCTEGDMTYMDKCLGLWRVEDL